MISIAVRAITYELRLWADLWRALRGTRVIPPDAVELKATRGLWTLPLAITAATAIEIVALELLLPWPLAKLALLVLSLYSLLWLWAVMAQRAVYPHYLDETSLTLRRGRTVVAVVARASISARRERNWDAEHHAITDNTLILGSGEGTNLTLRFDATPAFDYRWPWQKASPQPVTGARLWLDEPERFTAGGPQPPAPPGAP